MKFRVLVVDDHHLFRDLLSKILNTSDEIICDSQAANGLEALEVLKTKKVDVIILDLSMPKKSGFEAIDEISKVFPISRIIILTMYSSESIILHFLNKGVGAFLTKKADPSEIELAILNVMNSRRYLQRTLNGVLHNAFQSIEKIPTIEISAQERKLIQLLDKGLTSKEIADKMCLSVRTVSSYRENLLEKTKTKNMAELISYSYKNGILTVEKEFE